MIEISEECLQEIYVVWNEVVWSEHVVNRTWSYWNKPGIFTKRLKSPPAPIAAITTATPAKKPNIVAKSNS